MQTGALTEYIDVAQIVLYAFWIFFAGLIYYLHQENKREGYPLESNVPGKARVVGFPAMPAPKVYQLADGTIVTVPRPAEVAGQVDVVASGVGPGAYAQRRDVPDVTIDGDPRILPLRAVADFTVSRRDVDPRGLPVVGSDGVVGGVVQDVWVDRSEALFRYLEVAPEGGGGPVLVPVNFARIGARRVVVDSILGRDVAGVPRTRDPDRVTLLEEERVVAYYGAGTLYATPSRAEPLL